MKIFPWRIPICLGLLLLFSGAALAADAAPLLSQTDELAYRAAFGAARGRDWGAAEQLAAQTKEKLPSKILRWLSYLRGTDPGFSEITAFVEQNPGWPLLGTLRQRAEAASDGIPDAIVEAYFRRQRPLTIKGKLRFAGLLIAAGENEAADRLLRDLWIASDLTLEDEDLLLIRFGERLRPEDQAARLDRLLWAGQAVPARRQLARVSPETKLLGEARLALQGQAESAGTLVLSLPPRLRGSSGLLFDQLRWFRRTGRIDEAVAALRASPQPLDHAAAWWSERGALAQKLLDANRPEVAYELYAWRGLGESGGERADADFAAGWVALSRLKAPGRAYDHFVQLHSEVKTPISLARGAYWAGRALAAQGRAEEARKWFATAAEQDFTFYGQLAASRLGVFSKPVVGQSPQPTAAERDAFSRRELVQAARMLAQLGETDLAKAFLNQINAGAHTLGEIELVARLATATGHLDVALAAAKRAAPMGAFLLEEAYPTMLLDRKGPAEPALALAMIRQESGFDPTAVSRSGARGLMQLLPATAKDVAKSLGQPFATERLTQDPAYNVGLGRAYLGQLIENFGGSYVLAIASYNAGPGRVRQWIAAYGDPRVSGIDPADWIETMPYKETRNYVQRVLENLQVYRMRLNDPDKAFRIAEDLAR